MELSTLKLWRNWFGLMRVSGLEAPEPSLLVLAISTSSTVMGWVWNLAVLSFLLAGLLDTDGRVGGGGRLVRGMAGTGS